MTLPQEQLTTLQQDLASHERRIQQLREAIQQAEEEISLHEIVLELGRNERLITAIGGLYEDSKLESGFARDPLEYCREQDIQLPDAVTLAFDDAEGSSQRLTASVARGSSNLEAIWDREGGFFVRGISRPVFVQ